MVEDARRGRSSRRGVAAVCATAGSASAPTGVIRRRAPIADRRRASSWTTATPTAPRRRCAATGSRCVGSLRARPRARSSSDEIDVSTRAGHQDAAPASRTVRAPRHVAMGAARFARAAIPMRGPAWETFLGEPFDGRRTQLQGDGASRWATRTWSCSSRTTPTRTTSPHRPGGRTPRAASPSARTSSSSRVQGDGDEGPGLGARRRRDDGVRHRARAPRSSPRTRRAWSPRRRPRGSPAASCRSNGSRATRSCSPVPPSASPRASSTRRGWGRSRVEGRQARRVAAAVPVRRARPQARGQARRGRRRDLARRRRPRPADARARRRGDARGRARPLDAPLPELLRLARVPSGRRSLVRPPIRRRARPRDRGHGDDRLEGGDRAHRVRVRRPGGRGADPRPRVPGVRRLDPARRRHAGLAPDARGRGVPPRPRGGPG